MGIVQSLRNIFQRGKLFSVDKNSQLARRAGGNLDMVDAIGCQRWHLSASPAGDALIKDRTFRITRGEEHRSDDAKVGVQGSTANQKCLFQFRLRRQDNFCIASASTNMAVRTIGMQIGTRSRGDFRQLVVRIRIYHLAQGRYDDAIDCLGEAYRLPLKQCLPNFHTIVGVPLAASAHRRYAESLGAASPDFRQALARAYRLGRRAVWSSRFFPTAKSCSLREFGEICRLQGKHEKAMRYFAKSRDVAESQSESYELAKTNLAHAKLAAEMALPDAPQLLSDAQAKSFTR